MSPQAEAEMVDFGFDPDELVTWLGFGDMTLREALIEFRALPPQERAYVTLWRDRGKEPVAFDAYDLIRLAQLPGFQ
jgi:hypothetical protein